MCEFEHLLEHKKIDLDFMCGNGTITSGGGIFSTKARIVTPCSTKEWDNSYI
jgi:predicted outer membrane repeat protein